MGSGFAKMKKQARLLEQQVEKMRGDLQAKEYTASSAKELVSVTINGEKELKKIKIAAECVDPSDIEGLEDLIQSAMERAYALLNKENLPGNLTLPF